MRVLIIGGRGQLGRALQFAFSQQPQTELHIWNRPMHNLSDPAITEGVQQLQPTVVINAAAWTQVDNAESDPAAAYAANALGPKYLAEGCRRCGALFVQVSTNEVFDGEPGRFYREYDQPGGCASIYARSKLAGEVAVSVHAARWMIVRVAWLFGPGGNHFPSKIMAAADKLGTLRVVDDEFGNPTYAPDVAAAVLQLIDTGQTGIYHLVNEGHTSRFGLASKVFSASGRQHVSLTPIPASAWPRPALPPPHAVLVNQAAAALGIVLRPWQEAVEAYLCSEGR
jgi:dTDP-4-dehydrorhamnose reductase